MEIEHSRMRNDFKERCDMLPAKRIRHGEMDTQPPMMAFKAFLQSQDDNISDEEATAKYAEYKLEFRRQQLNDFFNAHKEEEWFKLKYHPEESLKRKEELKAAIHKRADIFRNMLEAGKIENLSLDADHTVEIEKFLDSVVIALEGGLVLDLMSLHEDSKSDKKEILNNEMGNSEDPTNPNNLDVQRVESNYEWIILDDVGGDDEDVQTKHDNVNGALCSQNKKTLKNEELPTENGEEMNMLEKEKLKDEVPLTPCPLHKTRSIFLRNISPRISKAEIEEVCKSYPGFLRIWLSEAQPDQRWSRRGLITFRRDVNIKQICWNLNNVKIKDCEWEVGVNHDLSRRARVGSGLSHLKQVVCADLKLSVKIIKELDSKAELWRQNKEETPFESENPVLKGITDFIVEESPAEVQDFLGKDQGNLSSTCDPWTLKVLDKLLLYLRVVHSVDYYNSSHYSYEDEMPNRCGIIHVRGLPSVEQVSEKEMKELIEGRVKKLEALYTPERVLTEAELLPLGMKHKESEVEKFITANTQELAKDKWLCPLSGKKFKAPEFIKKHMLNKFTKELEDIKKEVDYFNNYLLDPKRSELPEHPGFPAGRKEPEMAFHFPFGGGFRRGYGFSHFGGHGFFRGRGNMGRGRGMEFRPVITYRDLDSPCEPDEVI